jgi:hypothetical protein
MSRRWYESFERSSCASLDLPPRIHCFSKYLRVRQEGPPQPSRRRRTVTPQEEGASRRGPLEERGANVHPINMPQSEVGAYAAARALVVGVGPRAQREGGLLELAGVGVDVVGHEPVLLGELVHDLGDACDDVGICSAHHSRTRPT